MTIIDNLYAANTNLGDIYTCEMRVKFYKHVNVSIVVNPTVFRRFMDK